MVSVKIDYTQRCVLEEVPTHDYINYLIMKTEIEEVKTILQSFFENGEGEFLEECDLCHDYFDLQQIRITEEGYFYCDTCRW